MKFIYVGKNIRVTEGMKLAAEDKLSHFGEYFDKDVEVKVIMSVQKNYQVVEVTIYCDDIVIRAEESAGDIYKALEKIVDKIERLITKHKTKLQKRYHETIRYSLNEIDDNDCEVECTDNIVKRKTVGLKPMTEEEAILQMELLNHDFFVFTNPFGKINVIYKRKNAGYGLIESN